MDLKFKINPGHILAARAVEWQRGDGRTQAISVSSLCRDTRWAGPQGQQRPKGHLLRDAAIYNSSHI